MNRQRKPGLTVQEHKRLGSELYGMKIQLQRISIYLGNKYPFNRLRRIKIDRVIADIDKLRSECEELLFQDRGRNIGHEEAQELFKLYCPGQSFQEGKIIPLTKKGRSRKSRTLPGPVKLR